MREDVYSIFLMLIGDSCATLRYKVHAIDMAAGKALKFMKNRAARDLKDSTAFELPKRFTKIEYYSYFRAGQNTVLLEPLFQKLGAGPNPLVAVTMVQDGVITISGSIGMDDTNVYLRPEFMNGQEMDDWLSKYKNGLELNLTQMINDDYFEAIRILFKADKFVSAMKLFLSCIDSLAYIEFGDTENPFTTWLDKFADLPALGISSAELWELRNGIVHMTNLHSKKVRSNKVRRISFRIGSGATYEHGGIFYFDFGKLIEITGTGISRWIETYNADPSKFVKFIERYDQTISDSRMSVGPAK